MNRPDEHGPCSDSHVLPAWRKHPPRRTLEGNQTQPKNGAQCRTPFESLRIEPPDADRLKQLTPRVALLRTEARGVALPTGTLFSEGLQNRLQPVCRQRSTHRMVLHRNNRQPNPRLGTCQASCRIIYAELWHVLLRITIASASNRSVRTLKMLGMPLRSQQPQPERMDGDAFEIHAVPPARAEQFTGRPVNLASKPRPASTRTSDQAHCPWTLKSVSATLPAARSSCSACCVRRGRMRGEGEDGWGVGLVEGRWLRSSCYAAPPGTVAQQADGTDAEEDKRGGFGDEAGIRIEIRACLRDQRQGAGRSFYTRAQPRKIFHNSRRRKISANVSGLNQ